MWLVQNWFENETIICLKFCYLNLSDRLKRNFYSKWHSSLFWNTKKAKHTSDENTKKFQLSLKHAHGSHAARAIPYSPEQYVFQNWCFFCEILFRISLFIWYQSNVKRCSLTRRLICLHTGKDLCACFHSKQSWSLSDAISNEMTKQRKTSSSISDSDPKHGVRQVRVGIEWIW